MTYRVVLPDWSRPLPRPLTIPISICQRCTPQAYVAARLRPDSGGSGRGEEPARNAGAGRRALDEMNADWSDEGTNDPLVAECAQFLQSREMDARQHESRWLAGSARRFYEGDKAPADSGATVRRESRSSRIRASLTSASLGAGMRKSAGRIAAIAPLALINAA